MPPEQAKAILQVMEQELDARDAVVATRADVLASAADVKAEFASVKSEFAGLKSEFAGLKTEFAVLKSEFAWLTGEFATLRAEFAAFKAEIRADLVAFEARLAPIAGINEQIKFRVDAAQGRLSKWIVGCLLAQTALATAIFETIAFFQHRGR